MHSLLEDIGIVVVVATVIGLITHWLKQPIILGYLIAGIIVGPEIGRQLVTEPENVEIIGEIGLILLLFIIGLELNPQSIISSGKQLISVGVGQYLICVILGAIVFSMAGAGLAQGNLEVLYLALLCALSSTAIVVKSLNDKFELDTRSGKMSIGVLIIQDLWAILILAFQPHFGNMQLSVIGLALIKSILLVAAGFLVSKYVLRVVFESVSKSPEMVVSISIGWCALVAGTAGALGLSMEMGALIAGVSISTFPYSIHVTAKTLPLRDFFLTLFFVSLGMEIIAPEGGIILQSLAIAAFIVFSRFASIVPVLLSTGGGLRTAFITSLNLSQLSEFALVVAAIGVGLGHIHEHLFAVLIYTMAVTSIMSSYFIKYNHQIYHAFEHLLTKLGLLRVAEVNQTEDGQHLNYPILILGYHRGAQSLLETIASKYPALLEKILVIDFNLEVLKELRTLRVASVFGDIGHVDTLEHSHIAEADLIISTIPDVLLKGTTNLELVKTCRNIAPNATIVATADLAEQAAQLKAMGANEVVLPYAMTGEYLAELIGKTIKSDAQLEAAYA